MKSKHLIIAGLSIAAANLSHATITLNTGFGVAKSSVNTSVPDGTLWVLIVDTNGNSQLPGGLQSNSSLVAAEDSETIATNFSGATIDLGQMIAGDTIFAWGGFNGTEFYGSPGYSGEALEDIAYGTNGVVAGRIFGFYWFPGVSFTNGSTTLPTGSLQVGGVHDTLAGDGMSIPSDGQFKNVGIETTSIGGPFPESRLVAVAVPEASSLALSALGLGALLRRRRK